MAKLYDKAMTAIFMGNHAVVLPQALTASKGVWGKFRKASSLEPKGRLQRKHWDSREERFSILCHELQLKLIHCRRKVESVQSFLNTSPFSVGSPLRKARLSSTAEVHWSAQEMRTGVWASSFFWVSTKPRWPLKQELTTFQISSYVWKP